MTKKEVAKQWRSLLTKAIRSLPDVEYKCTDAHEDFTTQAERDHEAPAFHGELGALHTIELTVEEAPAERKRRKPLDADGGDMIQCGAKS